MEKWGTKLTIKFLKKYREHRCLWDFNDPDYKNRVERTKALQDIVTCMALNNFDIRSANVKIKALRSTYLHEKRKIRKSSKTGVVYKPKLAWYPLADSFLRNYVMEKFCLMGNWVRFYLKKKKKAKYKCFSDLKYTVKNCLVISQFQIQFQKINNIIKKFSFS